MRLAFSASPAQPPVISWAFSTTRGVSESTYFPGRRYSPRSFAMGCPLQRGPSPGVGGRPALAPRPPEGGEDHLAGEAEALGALGHVRGADQDGARARG